ncbi:hypothetical protein BC351_00585 [Paenibacillus ferrarius]|uniref:Uncharacterized protein n=1 Tax=Paenibacillus ferrarius TaxID=1469647 RepID=A0A1V4HS67_9BACL|nr:hypothetical protein [Paenibacillus ferrarius]OPH61771.1 hypothetical protein BC351_00585 [Paenibacillus ferrarius]
MTKKKKYVLIDAQETGKLELHVAFDGSDNVDQILCELPESSVLDLVKKYDILPQDFEIDIDVREYIKEKYPNEFIKLDF